MKCDPKCIDVIHFVQMISIVTVRNGFNYLNTLLWFIFLFFISELYRFYDKYEYAVFVWIYRYIYIPYLCKQYLYMLLYIKRSKINVFKRQRKQFTVLVDTSYILNKFIYVFGSNFYAFTGLYSTTVGFLTYKIYTQNYDRKMFCAPNYNSDNYNCSFYVIMMRLESNDDKV